MSSADADKSNPLFKSSFYSRLLSTSISRFDFQTALRNAVKVTERHFEEHRNNQTPPLSNMRNHTPSNNPSYLDSLNAMRQISPKAATKVSSVSGQYLKISDASDNGGIPNGLQDGHWLLRTSSGFNSKLEMEEAGAIVQYLFNADVTGAITFPEMANENTSDKMFSCAQQQVMKFDPTNGKEHPYPTHAQQYRDWHGVLAWLYNPWTGQQRTPGDIGTDVQGKLIANP